MARPVAPWSNWAGNQRSTPLAVEHPRTEEELVAVVRFAAQRGEQVKAVGSGHSFTDVACTTGRMVMFDQYNAVVAIDTERAQVTVQAGITLTDLNEQLDRRGLAMANLGDITYQTVSGAISTGTHGTGARLGGLAAMVIGMRIVTGTGEVIDATGDTLAAARVGLGALGLISTVTLQVVPAFNLKAVNEQFRLDNVLATLDTTIEHNDHFEFYWVPHTNLALTKSNNRTFEPLAAPSRAKAWVDSVLLENVAFGAICHAGKVMPAAVPRLAKALAISARTEYVDKSYKVFASTRLVKFVEMEYSIPAECCTEALNRVRTFIDREDLRIGFPVEVRFTAPDNIALSTAYGTQRRCYLAVHMFKGVDFEPYFRGVAAIMASYGGRPHWGKMHFETADTLADLYPLWDTFQRVRRDIDPGGIFANAYTDRVLGPITTARREPTA